jgi:hypothetical protein
MRDEEYFERLLVAAIEVEPEPSNAVPYPFTDLVTAARHRNLPEPQAGAVRIQSRIAGLDQPGNLLLCQPLNTFRHFYDPSSEPT